MDQKYASIPQLFKFLSRVDSIEAIGYTLYPEKNVNNLGILLLYYRYTQRRLTKWQFPLFPHLVSFYQLFDHCFVGLKFPIIVSIVLNLFQVTHHIFDTVVNLLEL